MNLKIFSTHKEQNDYQNSFTAEKLLEFAAAASVNGLHKQSLVYLNEALEKNLDMTDQFNIIEIKSIISGAARNIR